MFAPDQYQLLDFGAGRKLEQFGSYVLDRPSPAAEGAAERSPALWSAAHARFDRAEQGSWTLNGTLEQPWRATLGEKVFELKLTDFGHLGIFPEQADHWDWIARHVRTAERPLKVLNLFAYTGGSTLAAAAAGAEVVHVDAAANVVAWARRNAELSGLADAPIRWITEDASKFVGRELKRGNHYDAVILDPPGYGHGPKGETWKLEEDLDGLLAACLELTAGSRQFVLLTCHSGELAHAAPLLKHIVTHCPGLRDEGRMTAADMLLTSAAGERLHSGAGVRWSAHTRWASHHPTDPFGKPEKRATHE